MRVVVHLGDRSWRVIVAAVGARLDVALYPSSESRLLHGVADERVQCTTSNYRLFTCS